MKTVLAIPYFREHSFNLFGKFASNLEDLGAKTFCEMNEIDFFVALLVRIPKKLKEKERVLMCLLTESPDFQELNISFDNKDVFRLIWNPLNLK